MALTAREIEMIQVDVSLERPLRVKGREAELFAENLKDELKDIEKSGGIVDVPSDWPEA